MHNPAPHWHSRDPGLLAIDPLPVDNSPVGIYIHLRGPQPPSAFPEIAANPEYQDDGQCKIGLEEGFGRGGVPAEGVECDSELINIISYASYEEQW